MAMTRFACPGCNRSIGVPSKLLGHWIKCPHCGFGFAAMTDDPEPTSDTDAGVAIDPLIYQPRSRVPAVMVALLAGGAVLLVVLCLVIAGLKRSDSSAKSGAPASVVRQAQPDRYGTPTEDERKWAREMLAIDRELRDQHSWYTTKIIIFIGIGILYLVGVVLLLAWVARDARNRGVDGGAVWVLVILFTHWFGLLIYLASRPHGMLTVCTTCSNKRLAFSKRCPHCGHE